MERRLLFPIAGDCSRASRCLGTFWSVDFPSRLLETALVRVVACNFEGKFALLMPPAFGFQL